MQSVGTKISPKQEHAVPTTPPCGETLLVLPPVQGQELDSMILMGPFQLSIFHDSAIDSMIVFHILLDWASSAIRPCTKQFAFDQFNGKLYGLPGPQLKKIGF
ncbi:hypothetical protein HGM15179_003242 [Zosterops borbonicus]|uniref:Uncharacterized protein n=1 Tax=Zosterops borbonicus TaxID=364589 RepID=A0A8K1LS20_9PASS|nr:hypothetical protein HGM15179_003242 [Zosterops borbonicus]